VTLFSEDSSRLEIGPPSRASPRIKLRRVFMLSGSRVRFIAPTDEARAARTWPSDRLWDVQFLVAESVRVESNVWWAVRKHSRQGSKSLSFVCCNVCAEA
jgi:hypothetical protein